jgi:hypothetical protein
MSGAFLSLPPPALGECRQCSLERCGIAMRRRAVVSEGERPHPRHAHRDGGRLHDPANDDSVAEHVVVVIVPFAGETKGRRASEDEVVALHRAPPTLQHAGEIKWGNGDCTSPVKLLAC